MKIRTNAFQLTPTAILQSYRMMRRLNPQMLLLPIFGTCLGFAILADSIIAFTKRGKNLTPASLVLILVACFFVLFGIVGFFRLDTRIRIRNLRKTGLYDVSSIFEFDEEHVTIEDSKGSLLKLPWSHYQKIVKGEDFFLLIRTKQLAHWIPFSAFLSEEDRKALEGFLSEKSLLVDKSK
ncbi:MAG: YcxB family protein [Chloroflexi bacterium]|nr:YcxB family protein [Chloroflexota bacterium]